MLTAETQALIKARAAITGKTPDQVVRAALEPGGEHVAWKRPANRPKAATKDEFFAMLDGIAARSSARATADPRSPDEIIGYDDFGLPR